MRKVWRGGLPMAVSRMNPGATQANPAMLILGNEAARRSPAKTAHGYRLFMNERNCGKACRKLRQTQARAEAQTLNHELPMGGGGCFARVKAGLSGFKRVFKYLQLGRTVLDASC